MIIGDREGDSRPHDIRAFSGEVRGWEVAYRRSGSRDAPSFVDRGREIRIHDLQRDSVLGALQLSAQKWGTFQVFGSENYKRLCADLAAEHGFRITNPELQPAIALARDRRHQAPPTRGAPWTLHVAPSTHRSIRGLAGGDGDWDDKRSRDAPLAGPATYPGVARAPSQGSRVQWQRSAASLREP